MTKLLLQIRHLATQMWTFVCMLVVATFAGPGVFAAPRVAEPVTALAVTTIDSRVDGSTDSFSGLAANPGSDRLISLQEAIKAANNTPAGSPLTIQFNLPIPAPPTQAITLTLSQPLPALVRGSIRIDATTQPQGIRVVLYGGSSARTSPALLTIASSNNELRGLTIRQFFNDGVLLENNASANVIAGCTLEANGHNGVTISGQDVTQNQIIGSVLTKNGASGLELAGGAAQNRIGGHSSAVGNTITQNVVYGVLIRGQDSNENLIGANTITENSSGVALYEQSERTTVARNLISGNKQYGVWLDHSAQNAVESNTIGLAANGLTPQPNGTAGILLSTDANNNVVGGAESARNLISANGKEGIVLFGPENTISYNYIGVAGDGETAVGNKSYGIRASAAAQANQIEANLISANGADGVRLDSQHNLLQANRIGVSATGAALPNAATSGPTHGISVRGAENVIGPGNVVANHGSSGIYITGSDVQVLQNTIEANRRGICIEADEAQISENTIRFNGIEGEGSECDNQNGGVLAEADGAVVQENVIQSNIGSGVLVLAGVGNRVQENSISNNTEEGIVLSPGANGELAAPNITAIDAAAIKGQGCIACRIELFADDGDEGRALLGSTIADGAGLFSLAITREMLTGTFVTATATDANNNTSAFGTAFRVPLAVTSRFRQIYLPVARFSP